MKMLKAMAVFCTLGFAASYIPSANAFCWSGGCGYRSCGYSSCSSCVRPVYYPYYRSTCCYRACRPLCCGTCNTGCGYGGGYGHGGWGW